MDLHPSTGLAAVKEAGLWETFKKIARWEGMALVMTDQHGKRYMDVQPGDVTRDEDTGNPEIDRVQLRQMFLEKLPQEAIRGGSRFLGVEEEVEEVSKEAGEEDRRNNIALKFEHGVEGGFDLVVGSDGAWSKLRPALSDVQPYYSGIGGVDIHINDAAKRYPELSNFVGLGTYSMIGDTLYMWNQQNADGRILSYLWGQREEDWQEHVGYDLKNLNKVKAAMHQEYAGWMPEVHALIDAGDEVVAARSLYHLPVGHRWDARSGITLIGDSAHLMTPFAGEGVNVAMRDALDLSRAIIAGSKSGCIAAFNTAVREFEESMFHRGAAVAAHTWMNGHDFFFGCGFPTSLEQFNKRNKMNDDEMLKEHAELVASLGEAVVRHP